MHQVERQLKAFDREHKQLLHWALKGFLEEQIIAENKYINESRSSLESRKVNARETDSC